MEMEGRWEFPGNDTVRSFVLSPVMIPVARMGPSGHAEVAIIAVRGLALAGLYLG